MTHLHAFPLETFWSFYIQGHFGHLQSWLHGSFFIQERVD